MTSRPFPIALTRLDQTRCLVVGGGAVAERKVEALLEAGARLVVVSPALTPRLTSLVAQGAFEHRSRVFQEDDPRGCMLVIAATNDRSVNACVAEAARRQGSLVNVVDDPDAGSFYTMGVVRRGDLLLAVGTGGASPAFAALVRRKLEGLFGPEYGELLAMLRLLRPRVTRDVPAGSRPGLWRELAGERLIDWLRAGRQVQAEAYAETLIAQAQRDAEPVDATARTAQRSDY